MTFISYSGDCSLHLMLNASLESSWTEVREVKILLLLYGSAQGGIWFFPWQIKHSSVAVQASQGTAPDDKSIVQIDKQKTTCGLEICVPILTAHHFRSERQGIIKRKEIGNNT